MVEATAATVSIPTSGEIWSRPLGAGAAGVDLSGVARDENEIVLKQNTQYAFVIKSTTADDNIHYINLQWYEHSNR
jgi:hypothetical protein